MTSEIKDTGNIFNGGTQYTFEFRFSVRNYGSFMSSQGVNFASIKNAIESALRRNGSAASVPSVEAGTPPFFSWGEIVGRVNYRPVASVGIVPVGQAILDGVSALVPNLPQDEKPRAAPMLPGTNNLWGFVPIGNLWANREVVESDTIQIGETATPPVANAILRTHSDDPSRNGNNAVVNQVQSSFGVNWTIALAIGGSLLALGVVGYSAGRIAQLIGAVK